MIRALLATSFFFALALGIAHAAAERPNALDRRIDSISARDLSSKPATALVDPDRQVAAQRLAHLRLPGWFATIVIQILILAYFWQSGAAARVRDRLRALTRNEVLSRLGFGATLGLIANLAALIPEFYLYRVDRVFGLNDILSRAWAWDWFLNTIASMILVGITVALVLALVDRTHQWYVYTIVLIVATSLFVSYASPYFGTSNAKPHEWPPAIATRINALESAMHLQNVPVLAENTRRHANEAAVAGLDGTSRVLVPSGLIAAETPGELEFGITRELARIERSYPLRLSLYQAFFVIFGAALAVFTADRIGFRRDDDEVSRLALVAALLGVVFIIVAPAHNAIARSMTMRAYQVALQQTKDPDSAVRAAVREADQRMDEVCPDIATRLYLQSYPGTGELVSAANHVPSGCP